MPPTRTWKTVERQIAKIFGGNRVPLSGSNSGHNTGADVYWKDANGPHWLWIEVKRAVRYNRFFEQWYEHLKDGNIFCIPYNEEFLYVCALQTLMSDWGCTWREKVQKTGVLTNRHVGAGALVGLYSSTKIEAARYFKETILLCFRVHGKHHFMVMSDLAAINRIREWFKKNKPKGNRNMKHQLHDQASKKKSSAPRPPKNYRVISNTITRSDGTGI